MLIDQNSEEIWQRIVKAAARCNRDPKEIKLVAVSKKQPIEKMLEYQQICLKHNCIATFGENYVQEFEAKKSLLPLPFAAHLIGPLQSNKCKAAVQIFDVIESIHKYDIAVAVNNAAQRIGKIQEVFLQVNISNDSNKSGFRDAEIFDLVAKISTLANLRCTGLMTITEQYADPELARADFARMRHLRDEIRSRYPNDTQFQHISMGMSHDYEIAVEEGATFVRIGTALFGERT